jgi:hypothetical protein
MMERNHIHPRSPGSKALKYWPLAVRSLAYELFHQNTHNHHNHHDSGKALFDKGGIHL